MAEFHACKFEDLLPAIDLPPDPFAAARTGYKGYKGLWTRVTVSIVASRRLISAKRWLAKMLGLNALGVMGMAWMSESVHCCVHPRDRWFAAMAKPACGLRV